MSFTETARAALAARNKRIVFRARLKTSHPESNEWREYPLAENGFRLVRESGLPARLELDPVPPDGGFGAESDPSERWQLFAQCELWCDVYTGPAEYESQRLFDGILTEITPRDYGLPAVALDRLHILSRTVCAVAMEAEQIPIVDGAPLARAEEFDDHTFGLVMAETPDGFSAEGERRAWQPGDIRVFDSAGGELPPGSYAVYPDSGVVRFHSIPEDDVFISGVRCYIEGTNDVSNVLLSALTYPKEKGGPGLSVAQLDLPALGLDLNRVEWAEADGSVADFISHLRGALPGNVSLSYDSDSGRFKLRAIEQSETPDLTLLNPVSVSGPRDAHEVYTRVIIRGENPAPAPLSDDAEITDLQEGVGETFKWEGNKKTFDAGTIALVSDGGANTGFGRHNLPGEPYDWRDFALLDLGAPEGGGFFRISRVDVVAANSANPNSQSGANLIFLYGVELLGSRDGVGFVRIAPGAKCFLKALEVRTFDSLSFDRFRYLKVRVKPAKDGLSNQSDPGLALNEIRIWGALEYEIESCVQDDDPDAPFYFPALLEKTSAIGHLTYIEDAGNALDRYAAKARADALLSEFIRAFQAVEYSCIVDPTADVDMTAAVEDAATGIEMSFLIHRVVIEGTRTVVSGVDYLSAPLS
ncbi:MAG: hypothetical protein HRF49_01450 [bacterium]|jgi:hypothetical protein